MKQYSQLDFFFFFEEYNWFNEGKSHTRVETGNRPNFPCLLSTGLYGTPLPTGGVNFLPDISFKASAAAAKSLQSCLTLCDPIDGSPPGSPIPGILQARTLEWVAISFSNV